MNTIVISSIKIFRDKSESQSSLNNSILAKWNSINKVSIKGRPISSKPTTAMSTKPFAMHSAYKNFNRENLLSRESKLTLSSNAGARSGGLHNYRSIIPLNNNDLKSSNKDKNLNTYWDISVEPKPASVRKGTVLHNNKFYTSGREKLKSAGIKDGKSRNKSVRLRFFTKQSNTQCFDKVEPQNKCKPVFKTYK